MNADDDPDILIFMARSALDARCQDLFRRIAPVDHELVNHDYGAYCDEERGYFETILHEIAHCVVMRRGVRAALRRPFTDLIGDAMPKFPENRTRRSDPVLIGSKRDEAIAVANDHEIMAIAVSVIASNVIGVPLDARCIADAATDGGNVRDLGTAEAVTCLIRAAMKRPDVLRWGRDLGKFLGMNHTRRR